MFFLSSPNISQTIPDNPLYTLCIVGCLLFYITNYYYYIMYSGLSSIPIHFFLIGTLTKVAVLKKSTHIAQIRLYLLVRGRFIFIFFIYLF